MMQVRKAVIPAAGFGTRFLPATKALPKEMLPIVDTPTLQYVVEEAVNSGVREILIILGKNKKCIEDHFDIAVELEQLLVKTGKFDYLQQIRDIADMAHIHYYETTGCTVLGCQTVKAEDADKYGMIDPGPVKGRYTRINGIVEKPAPGTAPSLLASMGRFVFTPEIFDVIKTLKPHDNGETYLTDAIEIIAKTSGAYAYDMEGERYDVGDKFGFVRATIEYALRDKTLSPKLTPYIRDLAGRL